ncbi:hypothetical protein WKW79_33010 [Variovorax robiniae]|uniref:MarR family transcriptional regulator n=1 Tax=Variovorax robiniae TaxID=1836199 RepID=A0ABU8XHS0_9BURK
MAMDLLRRIAASPLPASFSSPDDIDKLRVLHAAGLLLAVFVADAASSRSTETHRAMVTAITEKGLQELRAIGEPDSQLRGVRSTGHLVSRLRELVERARGVSK